MVYAGSWSSLSILTFRRTECVRPGGRPDHKAAMQHDTAGRDNKLAMASRGRDFEEKVKRVKATPKGPGQGNVLLGAEFWQQDLGTGDEAIEKAIKMVMKMGTATRGKLGPSPTHIKAKQVPEALRLFMTYLEDAERIEQHIAGCIRRSRTIAILVIDGWTPKWPCTQPLPSTTDRPGI